MKLLIRPAQEVAIKSKPVRRQQMRLLRQNIRKLLAPLHREIRVSGSWDRVDVLLPEVEGLAVEAIDVLQRTPGISVIQEISTFPLTDMDSIARQAQTAFACRLQGRTFAVRARRIGDHGFRSMELERHVGRLLLERSGARGVDLKQPDVEVRIEVRDDHYHLAHQRHRGLGGHPLGSVESVMTLMSGGFDSSVAAYLLLRRGVRNHFVFFNLGGPAHEVGVRQVVHYLWRRYGASHSAKFISVPFEGVVAEIMRCVNSRYWGVVLKRRMLHAASEIARANNASALVTGDSVAQVSSQTMSNLNVVDRATDTLVLRPLVSMDKEQIIRLATEIGTEPFARNMPEYCGVISERPATRARLGRVEAEEAGMDDSVLTTAMAAREECRVADLLDGLQRPGDVELIRTPEVGDVIIDLRHPEEGEQAPLHLTNNDVVRIPFYELSGQVAGLRHDQRYLLYCDRGTMSRMQAGQLQAEGHTNIKVYAPARG